ncbi:hypothetical protein BO78DRAFT_386997 [Aspergillus sclerotiicarbonarius CBS 121057]|uniref:Uncharacterized protein n=1 Tax=Aspergillus sclerotiicarbonarius (strain CBS 121057 / IBT 28362) TaxID=1448318 RepID=A0A319FGU8_ASPSB|nr:hypothetical protein BO78DRAFT_386997 [Aspergillus sclerotiicarbonarius CBS 121057]
MHRRTRPHPLQPSRPRARARGTSSSSPTSTLTPLPIPRYSPPPSSSSPRTPNYTYYYPPGTPYPTPPPSPPPPPSNPSTPSLFTPSPSPPPSPSLNPNNLPSTTTSNNPPTTTTTNKTKTKKTPQTLPQTLHHLQTKLHPLISSTTGHQHPDFPSSLLTYHLLTSTQLDSLARHFHQIHPPVRPTYWYPITIPPWVGTSNEGKVDLETKRRRFGRFIGLRGCESPISETYPSRERAGRWRGGEKGGEKGGMGIRMFRDVERDVLSDMLSEFGEVGDGDVDVDVEGIMAEIWDGEGEHEVGNANVDREEDKEESPQEMLERMEREWILGLLRARFEGDVALRWKFGRG